MSLSQDRNGTPVSGFYTDMDFVGGERWYPESPPSLPPPTEVGTSDEATIFSLDVYCLRSQTGRTDDLTHP